MKVKHKVKLTCNWCSDEALYERFTRCYVSEHNFNSDIQFTNSNTYDWLVIINAPRYKINFPKEKTLGVIMEPTWSPAHQMRPTLEYYCNHILFHKKTDNSQYIFHPGLLPYHFDYEVGNNLDYYINTKFLSKTKKCSMVVTYNDNNIHPECLYKQRVNFAKLILKTNLDVDIYGTGWDTCGILDQRIKGQLINKKNGLLDYEFSIAIENCVEQGFFTEKISDCILTDSTPIYFGCPDIDLYLNNICKLTHLNDTTELASILNTKPLEQHKTIFATKYNLYSAITKYIKHQTI
jgi:hypothetical protein